MMNDSLFKSKTGAFFTAVFCMFLWGSAFAVLKVGYVWFDITDTASKIVFAGLRFTLAGPIVWALNRLFNPGDPIHWQRAQGGQVLLLALFATVVQYIFFYIGVGNTTGVRGSIYATAGTFMVVLFSPLFFKSEKMTALKILGLLLGFCGIVLTSLSSGTDGLTFGFSLMGEGALLLAGLGDAAGTIVAKKLSREMNPFHYTFYQMTLGGLGLLAFGFVLAQFTGGVHLVFSVRGVLLLYAAFISGAAFGLCNMLLKFHPAGTVTAYKFLIPVFGSIISAVVLHESFTPWIVYGLVASAAGVYCVNRSR